MKKRKPFIGIFGKEKWCNCKKPDFNPNFSICFKCNGQIPDEVRKRLKETNNK